MALPARDVTVEAALAAVLDVEALGVETLPVDEAIGRVLAEHLDARWDLPGAPVSVMDGWAVYAADLQTARARGDDSCMLPVIGESAAGHPHAQDVSRGHVAQISTGAVLPPGTDAVVPREESTRPADDRALFDATALAETAPGRYVRPTGSDVQRGARLLDAGQRLGPGEFSLLAAAGHQHVNVVTRPRVHIVGTGDELVPVGAIPGRGQVVSTNARMLAAQVEFAGGCVSFAGDVPDEKDALAETLRRGLESDLLLTTGGASVGDHDLVLGELTALGFAPRFVRVRLRPGRPTMFGFVGATPVLVLPGNPASSHVAFELLGRPLIRRLAGFARDAAGPRYRVARLEVAAARMRSRDRFDRGRLDLEGGVTPLAQQQSGALRSIAAYDALIRVPAGEGEIRAGSMVEIIEVPW